MAQRQQMRSWTSLGASSPLEGIGPVKRWLPFIVIAVIGVIAAIAAYQITRQNDAERIRGIMEPRAEWRAKDLEHKLEVLANSVETMAVFVGSQANLDGDLFRRFAARSRRVGDPLRRLMWAPRVRSAPSPGTEMQAGGTPGGRDGSDSFPVEVEYGPAQLQPITGLDLATDPVRRRVLDRSRDEARPLSTPVMPLFGTTAQGYFVVWPIYENGLAPVTIGQRQAQLRGFVAGSFPVESALNAALEGTPLPVGPIYFFAESPTLPATSVATYSPASGLVEGGTTVSRSVPDGSLRLTRAINVFGREWTVVFDYDESVLAPLRSSGVWGFPIGILLLTAVLLAYLAKEQGYRREVERRVAERTADLRTANEALALEIEARKKTSEQLVQAQKMEAVGNLTGGMAHDFNNLLAIIIANLDLLRELQTADGEAQELTGEALDAALRGADLTRRLLAFARRQPLQPELTRINELVMRITQLLKRTLGEQIEISLDLDPDTWPVFVDPAQLEAGLTNLATNARDAMPKGGQLTIVTGNRHLDADYASTHTEVQPGDYAMIEVTDSGSGMPPEVLAQVFEPFFTTKPPGKGTGLGLSMVFGFIKQSGGHINVYSEVGIGTTIRLYLRRGEAAADVDRPTTGRAPLRGKGETVLAVEDNASLRRVVVRQLTELGYRVLEAEDAPAALRVLENESVDILFTDIVMPGGTSGYEIAAFAASRWPGMKVVLTSGFPENKINGSPKHNLRLLSKPYRRDDLSRIIRETLDS